MVNDKLKQLLESQKSLKEIINNYFRLNKDKSDQNEDNKNIDNKINSLQTFVVNEFKRINQLINSTKKEDKEKQVVEKSKPVYLDSFSDKALSDLDKLFQKIFNITIIEQSNEQRKINHNLWLIPLMAIVGIIVAKYEDIYRYIKSIDWEKIWNNTKEQLANFLIDLPIKIYNNLSTIFVFLGDLIKTIFTSDKFKQIIDNVKKTIVPTDLIDNIKTEISNFFTKTIPNLFNSMIDNIKQYINNIFNSINDFLGFKLFDTGESDKDKTNAIDAEGTINELNNQDNSKNISISESPSDNQSGNIDPNIAVANNLQNFNQIKNGNINKSFMVKNNNDITLTPLNSEDNAIILKEGGLIDNRLNHIINVINEQTSKYVENFNNIKDGILQQNNILDKLNSIDKKDILNILNTNNIATSKYINHNINQIQNMIIENKQPIIEKSNIDLNRLQYING